MTTERSDVTALLTTAGIPGGCGVDDVVPLVYDELRAMAHRQLAREHSGRGLQTTALVHEAYLKLVDRREVTERGRAYFFAAAARAIRQVLVDHARRRGTIKRGGDVRVVTLDADEPRVDAFAIEVIDLDRALEALSALSPRQATVVECRYFGGMTVEETAQALGVSARTVKSDWAIARAWLFDRLEARGPT